MSIKGFRNNNNNYKIFESDGSDSKYLSSLSKINIFVGANNSGKSRFLRQLFTDTANHDFSGVIKLARIELEKIRNQLPLEIVEARFFIQEIDSTLLSQNEQDFVDSFNQVFVAMRGIVAKNGDMIRGHVSQQAVAKMFLEKVETSESLRLLGQILFGTQKLIYIPILRGLRIFEGAPDIYLERTVSDYALKNTDVFTGLGLYQEILEMKNGGVAERRNFERFTTFLEEEFFNGQKFELTPTHGSKVLHININNETQDKAIHNVGDGIQSIIIATFQAFKHQDEDTIIFIEEPELLMHPSMQRTLMESFIKRFPKLQVFCTAHSNHFLDLTYDYPDDISIFSIEKHSEKDFHIRNITENSLILDLLGIRNSSVFLANGVIWTEGVTDRMLLRKLLELKSDFDFKEDKHYAFAEYGGSNLGNFAFVNTENILTNHVQSVSKNNFLVADNDGRKNGEEKEILAKAKEVFSDEHFFADHIEIENLIPFKIWVPVIQKLSNQKGYTLKDGYESNEESFNSRLETEKIGILLKDSLIEKTKEELGYFEGNSIICLGADKKTIMSEVVEQIDLMFKSKEISLDDFPRLANQLVSKIHRFVEHVNK